MNEITVNASRTYRVFTGNGFVNEAGALLKNYSSACKVLTVSDETVFSLYGKSFIQSLNASGFDCFSHILPGGEVSKSRERLFGLWEELQKHGFTRSDIIVSLGGGVVSDLAGFAASTYMRGLPHIIFPTTLLSMADASVGGKTAINLNGTKNAVGTFYPPRAVYCDTDTLLTLPSNTFSEGMAEIIKCGMICSAELLEDIRESKPTEQLIATAVNIKKDYTEKDETDTEIRRFLNFGHTFAHGIEKLSAGTISHGRAVAMGMCLVTEAAVNRGQCKPEAYTILSTLLKKYNLPTTAPYSKGEIVRACLDDKKRSGNKINLIIPTDIGKSRIYNIDIGELKDFLSE